MQASNVLITISRIEQVHVILTLTMHTMNMALTAWATAYLSYKGCLIECLAYQFCGWFCHLYEDDLQNESIIDNSDPEAALFWGACPSAYSV